MILYLEEAVKRILLGIIFVTLIMSFESMSSCDELFLPREQKGLFQTPTIYFGDELFTTSPLKDYIYPSHFIRRTQNLSEGHRGLARSLGKAWEESDFRYKFSVSKSFEIENIIAAPGHNTLRSESKINSLSKYILQDGGNNFSHDKLILNIITDDKKNIIDIDAWNGHHRLVAYLKAGKKTIEDIGHHNLTILVNGNVRQWERWEHWLPAHGINPNTQMKWKALSATEDGHTLRVAGDVSNYSLGSRQTVGQITENIFQKEKPNVVAVHVDLESFNSQSVRLTELRTQYSEVILIPKIYGPKNLHQRALTEVVSFVKTNPELNLLIIDQQKYYQHFGRDPELMRRYVGNSYGYRDIELISLD